MKKNRVLKEILLYLLIAAVAVLAAFLVRTFVIFRIEVEQTSMTPTLMEGENKWVYRLKKPTYGDIVVFKHPNPESGDLLIKRVMALEGDTIWSDGTYVHRIKKGGTEEILENETYNGVTLSTKTAQFWDDEKGPGVKVVVPDNCFFAMGDNRPASADSRNSFGCVDFSLYVGKVL